MFDEKSLFIQRMETKNSQLLLRYNSKLSFEPVAVSAKESFPPVWRVLGSGHTDGHWFDWVTDIICGVIFSLTVSHRIRDLRNRYVTSVCVYTFIIIENWPSTVYQFEAEPSGTHSTIYIDEFWTLAKEMRWGLDDFMDIPALISFLLKVPLWCNGSRARVNCVIWFTY